MADQKLSQLTTATLPLNDNDLFYVVQNTTSTSSTSQSVKFVDLSSQINPGGGGGTVGALLDYKVGVLASDQPYTSITLADIPGLSWSVAANEVWLVEFVAIVDAPTAADFQSALSLPSGGTFLISQFANDIGTSADQVNDVRAQAHNINAGFVAGMGVGSASGFSTGLQKYVVTIGSTAGTLKMQAAQFVASGTTTLKAGSYLKGERIL